jgi:hypothetical protein
MSLTSFDTLPDHSRLWVFNTARPLTAEESTFLHTNLEAFLTQWAAHGSQLTAGYEILHDRFILLGVDDSMVGPSGCSIDAMTRFLVELERRSGLAIVDAPDVCYRDGQEIRCVDRIAFSRLASEGAVDNSTIVFDKTVTTVGALRAGAWERQARESWHAKAFDLKNISAEAGA